MIEFNDLKSSNQFKLWFKLKHVYEKPKAIDELKEFAATSDRIVTLCPLNDDPENKTFALQFAKQTLVVEACFNDVDPVEFNRFFKDEFVVFSRITNLYSRKETTSVIGSSLEDNPSDESSLAPYSLFDLKENLSLESSYAIKSSNLALEIECNFFRVFKHARSMNILPKKSSDEDKLSAKNKKAVSLSTACEACTYKSGNASYCFVLLPKIAGASENEEHANLNFIDLNGSQIIGKDLNIKIEVEKQSERYRLLGSVTKSSAFKNRIRSSSVIAFELELKSDEKVKDLDPALIELLKGAFNSNVYFKIWQKYDIFELKKQARLVFSAGYAQYKSFKEIDDNVFQFSLQDKDNFSFRKGEYVTVSYLKPDLENLVTNDAELLDLLGLSRNSRRASSTNQVNTSDTEIVGQVVEVSLWQNPYINIEFASKIADSIDKEGYISLSLRGFLTRVKRRETAIKALMSNNTGITNLDALFDLDDPQKLSRIAHKGNISKHEPLSSRIREKIFKHDPTNSQLSAIKIAINTPDIALIQGPPGTGKTTVIQAIVERLNELMRKNGESSSSSKKILVTSYQHEAVENVANKICVNSLPTFKFGSSENSENQTYDLICRRWSDDISHAIHDKYCQELKQNKASLSIMDEIARYECTPCDENALRLVKAIKTLPSSFFNNELPTASFNSELLSALYNEEKRLSKRAIGVSQESINNALRYVYALRTSALSFKDDGVHNLLLAYECVKDLIQNQDLKERFEYFVKSSNKFVDDDQFFVHLKDLQQELLLHLQQPTSIITGNKSQSTSKLIALISKQLDFNGAKYEFFHSNVPTSQDKRVLQVVTQFVDTLDKDHDLVKQTLQSMNIVVAATVQQSVNKQFLSDNLPIDGKAKFDTVIVDEAARSTPIDLLIPMVLASRRIILVGDHKQLPHIVDDEIESKLLEMDEEELNDELFKYEEALPKAPQSAVGLIDHQISTRNRIIAKELNSLSTEEMINLSMFEFLFKCLKKLEAYDKVTRTITLDNQFRMHPALGKLVSNEFYDGKLFSPLPEQNFSHNLIDAKNVFARWYDVSCEKGLSRREGQSLSRLCEAIAIVDELKKWLKDSSSKGMTFGVVSFYRGQVNLINEVALQEGLLVSDGTTTRLNPVYDDKSLTERLRIETVDSLQGKEFDVVLLSMVRSKSKSEMNAATQSYRSLNAKAQDVSYKLELASSKEDESKLQEISDLIKANITHLKQRTFGYMVSENRLCVALSRQRKILCVFGDRNMLENELGEHAVPALSSFLKLCKKEGQILPISTL